MDNQTAVQFDNISKSFPGVRALQNVSFSISEGEVHALVGENGAGKSTLLNILHGLDHADTGDILIFGKKVRFASPTEALKAGIAKVHQEIHLVHQLTVGQNIALGFEKKKGPMIDFRKMYEKTDFILTSLGCKFKSTDSTAGLSVGEMQMVVIAKALYHDTRVISFDEPTASLSGIETDRLFEIIEALQKKGITILYVSHKLDEIYRLAKRVSVLRDGQYIQTCCVAETSKADLIKNMVGRDVSSYAVRINPSSAQEEVVLVVDRLYGKGFFDISFTLRRGEILGFSGLIGAKRSDVVQALFGADKIYSGSVTIFGKTVKIHTCEDGRDNGIGLLSENRKTWGFVPGFNNCDNMALAAMQRFCRGGVIDEVKKLENFSRFADQVALNIRDPEHLTKNLSGGNQQKVILAKWLSSDVEILVFDEPTKGVDVGAKTEIYRLMEEFVADGKSIILVSSEMPEIIGMCDRTVVMKGGHITAILEKEDLKAEIILSYAMEGKRT